MFLKITFVSIVMLGISLICKLLTLPDEKYKTILGIWATIWAIAGFVGILGQIWVM